VKKYHYFISGLLLIALWSWSVWQVWNCLVSVTCTSNICKKNLCRYVQQDTLENWNTKVASYNGRQFIAAVV